MKKNLILIAILANSILANEYPMKYFSIKEAMQSELFKELDKNISFEFGTDSSQKISS